MPVRNAAEVVGLAIRSIALQTYGAWELLVIDDGSTDDTLSVVERCRDPRVAALGDKRQRGIVARLNEALDHARGTYFARMDADDIAYPERIARQAAFLHAHPDVDLVGAAMLVYGERGRAIGRRAGPSDHAGIVRRPAAGFRLFHPTFMGRVDWFRKFGYDPRAHRCEDQDLLLRSYRHSRFANLPEVLHGYFEETVSLTRTLSGRWSYVASLARENSGGRVGKIAAGLLHHVSWACVDAVGAATGLGHRMLRNRSIPASAAELEQWRRVWALVAGDASSAGA